MTTSESVTQSDDSGTDPVIEVSGLKKHFRTSEGFLDRLLSGEEYVQAVDGVDLEIRPNETLAVVGESGCGKSTLAQTLMNLHSPTDGTIRFEGDDITGLDGSDMRPYRKDMQIIFQDPLASLNPRKTVGDILTAPMEVHNIGEDDADRRQRARDLLDRVGLKPVHIDRYPQQFSGGQQQRIGIARALTVKPDLLVADEPVSALDVSVQSQVLSLLDDLQDEFDIAMLFIAHDLSVVRHIADRVAVMYLGEFVERGPIDDVFEEPAHPYTRSLISAVPRIDPADRGDRVVLEGTVPSPIDPPEGCRFHTRCPVVIPPDDWTADQEAFAEVFTLRNRLLAGEVDPEAVRTRVATGARESEVSDEAVKEQILASDYPGSLGDLPPEVAERVEDALDRYVDGEREEAESVLRDALPSPCVRHSPSAVEISPDHAVRCHRRDDSFDAEPIWND